MNYKSTLHYYRIARYVTLGVLVLFVICTLIFGRAGMTTENMRHLMRGLSPDTIGADMRITSVGFEAGRGQRVDAGLLDGGRAARLALVGSRGLRADGSSPGCGRARLCTDAGSAQREDAFRQALELRQALRLRRHLVPL